MKKHTESNNIYTTKTDLTAKDWLRKVQHDLGYTGSELQDALWNDLTENNLIEWPRRIREIFDAWFNQVHRTPLPKARAAATQRGEEIKASLRDQTAERYNAIKAEARIDLLHQIWGNGKSLAKSTLADIIKYGETEGAFKKRIAAMAQKAISDGAHPRTLGGTIFTKEQLCSVFNTSGRLNAPRGKKGRAI